MMPGINLNQKRKAFDDISDRPNTQPRMESIFIKDEEDASEDEAASVQALLKVSSSTIVGENHIDNPDPDVEGKLQEALIDLLEEKRNVFITGPAGSGKSYMTKGLISKLHAAKLKVSLVAPTGTAAMNIGGKTCHAFFGLNPNIARRGIVEVIKAAKNPKIERRLQKTDCLVIDEVSMISNEFFEQMSRMAQEARKNDRKPFGGMLIIAIGDFAQLGPVKGLDHCIECGQERRVRVARTLYECPTHGAVHDSKKWAFVSDHWGRLRFKVIVLEKILRQKDEKFAQIVFDLWLGNTLAGHQLAALKQERPVVEPTLRLFATREAVDKYNNKEWKKLTSPPVKYICQDKFVMHQDHQQIRWIKRLAVTVRPNNTLLCHRNHRYLETLCLRVGMPVILLHNLSVNQGLVNGSQGQVIGFERYSPTQVRTSDGGLTSSGYSWEDESGLVLEDYVPSLGGGPGDWKHDGVREFWLDNGADTVPIVKFYNGVTKTVTPECNIEEVIHGQGISQKIRIQIPLMPGWASTVHRAQGMSLNRVVVDFSSIFETAQYYVSISRARSLDGLNVLHLDGEEMLGHPSEILQFMRTILPPHIRAQMRN